MVEAAGNTCLWIPNTLHEVRLGTTTNRSPNNGHELKIVGLKEPQAFKRLVLAMKQHAAGVGEVMLRGDSGRGADEKNSVSLLLEIRDELRQQNVLLRNSQLADAPELVPLQNASVVAQTIEE